MNNKGFTLIDFIIYIAISAMLLSSLILITVNMLQARVTVTAMEEISKSSRFIVENISYAIRCAQSANLTIDGDLELAVPFPASYNLTTIQELNNNLMMRRGSEGWIPLNTKATKVEFLSFDITDDCIQVTFDLKYDTSEGSRYETKRSYQFTECIRR